MNQARNSGAASASNTLLSQLGFADRDRASPRHDLACAYAAWRARDLACLLTPAGRHVHAIDGRYPHDTNRHYREFHDLSLECEVCVCRPNFRRSNFDPRTPSSFLIGFADGVLRWTHGPLDECSYQSAIALCEHGKDMTAYHAARDEIRSSVAIVEIKIGRVGAGDVIRQIECYRGGVTSAGTVLEERTAILLLDYAISKADRDALLAKHIRPLRLGPAFEEFISANDRPVEIDGL